jgi:hypothetical protein
MKSSVTDWGVTGALTFLIKNYMTKFKALCMPQCNFRYFVVEGKWKPDLIVIITIITHSLPDNSYTIWNVKERESEH